MFKRKILFKYQSNVYWIVVFVTQNFLLVASCTSRFRLSTICVEQPGQCLFCYHIYDHRPRAVYCSLLIRQQSRIVAPHLNGYSCLSLPFGPYTCNLDYDSRTQIMVTLCYSVNPLSLSSEMGFHQTIFPSWTIKHNNGRKLVCSISTILDRFLGAVWKST